MFPTVLPPLEAASLFQASALEEVMGGQAQLCQPILHRLICRLPSWADGQGEGGWSAGYRVELIRGQTAWMPDPQDLALLTRWGEGEIWG